MKNTKKILKKLTSLLLSLTLILQLVTLMPVSASDFSGTPGFNLPYHTTLKPTESAAWSIAREVIKIVNENSNLDLTWASNYFHNQVQRQIHDE